MAKSNIFKGVAAALGLVLPVAAYMSVLAFDREGDVNLFLRITAGGPADVGKYKSAYESKEAYKAAEIDYEIRAMEEGSVLLRNENDALPLKKINVTLFGNAAVRPNYHGGSGGPSNTGVSLIEALKEEGFSLNQKVIDKIQANGHQAGNKDIAEVDPSIYDPADMAGYKDAAIVVISRYGGEENDLDLVDNDGVPELSLHEKERQMLEFVKAQGFEKVIVLLNTGYVMETSWIEEYADAALWIAFPGSYGFKGVAKMLNGSLSPSGRLPDIYPTNIASNAAMPNWGGFKFADLVDLYHSEYVVYAEGIYSGYKYYETRYADLVQGLHNADTEKGATATVGAWDYAAEVVYPFGYGLNYATFTKTLDSLTWDRSTHKVEAKVTVKNTHATASSRHSVPLYVNTPYIENGLEKSAVTLIAYEKTGILAPGESETLTITADDYLFASYDAEVNNAADPTKKGNYVFDEGDYVFAIGESSHDALNNALAKRGISGLYDPEGNATPGNPALAHLEHLASRDLESHAKNEITGQVVSNHFEEVDINHFIPGAVDYMTRADWNSYPDAVIGLKAGDDASGVISKYMTAFESFYEKPADAPDVSSFKFGQDNGKKFIAMANVAYDDDEAWNSFLDQLTLQELAQIPGEKMANMAIESVSYPKNTSCDGPDGLQTAGVLHPSQTLAAASFSHELLKLRGQFLAEDAVYAGISMVYGGGCNMHRTPYSGRNFEYYSEDSNLSYLAGRDQGKAMSEKGLLGAFKHFLGNDQETNRHGVATFMTEQMLREGPARAFEGALSDGGAMANMGSFNRIGVVPTSSCRPLMTDLLRTEWGFKGISITDSSKDAKNYIFTADAIVAGTTLFNNDEARSEEVRALLARSRDGYVWQNLRLQAKNFFYSYLRSNIINGLSEDTVVHNTMEWWKVTIIAIDASLGALLLGAIAAYSVALIKGRKKEAK